MMFMASKKKTRKKYADMTEEEKKEAEALNELSLSKEERQALSQYRKDVDRRLKELQYESRNGHMPNKPWYEDDDGWNAATRQNFHRTYGTECRLPEKAVQKP